MPSFPTQGGSDGAWGTELENFFAPFFDFATGELRMNGGSLANPIIGFKTSPATGIFSPGLDQLGVAVNGVQALLFSPLGDATFRNISAISYTGDGSALTGIASGTGGVINTGSTTIGADSDSTGGGEIVLQIKGITEVALNNAGNLGVGTPSPTSQLTVGGALDFLNLNTPPTGPGIYLGINTLQVRMGTGGFTLNNSLNTSVRLSVLDDGNVGIGTTTPNINALLDISSTTKAFMPPRMTTTQRDAIPSPTKGMMIYNITTNVPDHYNGTVWGAV